jgi:hypothetical protein
LGKQPRTTGANSRLSGLYLALLSGYLVGNGATLAKAKKNCYTSIGVTLPVDSKVPISRSALNFLILLIAPIALPAGASANISATPRYGTARAAFHISYAGGRGP